jgi:dephospho-CoA kinase
LSEAEAKQRITAQTPQADKLAKATVVIKNDGNVEETWKQVQAAYANALKRAQPAGAAPATPAQPAAPAAPAAPPASDPTQPSKAVTAPLKPPPGNAAASVPSVPINVKRGMPSNAEVIAGFISEASGKPVNRMDVMMAFGQKSYLLAQDTSDKVLAVMGWQVENLITRVDEFYTVPGAPTASIVDGLVTAVEAASKDLQSEVAYVFLPATVSAEAVQGFVKNGYEATTIEQIKIPAWREAVQEVISTNQAAKILSKKLREDRVLKPI